MMSSSSKKLKQMEQYSKKLEYKLEIQERISQNQEYSLAPPKLHDDHHEEHNDHDWGFEKWSPDERKRKIQSLDVNPFEYEKDENRLLILAYDLFATLGLPEKFNIPMTTLQSFILVLRDRYRAVPFHNFYHAFNVAQSLYFFLTTCKAGENFSPLECLSMLIAAFCHDIDHPGLNNAFQISCCTGLAMLYNDTSVLEQHHCYEAFRLLGRKDCNILANLTPEQYKEARKIITACVLATDLAEHGKFIGEFKAKRMEINWTKFEDKKLVMCMLVKCADISNEIRPQHIGRQWAAAVTTEFFIQSAIEKEKGLPFSPMMDPDKTSLPQSQVGFIGFLCQPLFQEVSVLFPAMDVCVKQMQSNKEQWQQLENQLKEKREKEAASNSNSSSNSTTASTTTSANNNNNNANSSSSSGTVPSPSKDQQQQQSKK